MKRIALLLCFFVILFSGCSGKAPSSGSPADVAEANVEDTSRKFPPRHRDADHIVVVMLGEDYVGRPAILDALVTEYGLSGFGGMVLRLDYPESFKEGSRTRLAVLAERASDPSVTVVLALGAPEGTVRELNKIRANAPGTKILNLFPLDETLPCEAVSDLVADYPSPDELLADENATPPAGSSLLDDGSLAQLMLASVLAWDGTSPGAPVELLSASLETARDLMKLKKNAAVWKLAPWVDPDTGLKSRNHLVVSCEKGPSE